MAIGLTRSKNLSESNLNLKTALQKLYAPGIEDDIELFSLSSSIESVCFSGLFASQDTQIFRLTTERLSTLSGDYISRTKFSTKYFTFTDENRVYFTEYEPGIGNNPDARAPRYSNQGSVPAVRAVSGGGGFYFLDSQDGIAPLENFSATWNASSSSTITVTLSNHGFREGQGLSIRFNNSGGGTNAVSGEYAIVSTQTNTFTVVNIGGSITGSGQAIVSSSDVRLSNVQLRGKTSGSTSLRADVTFGKQDFNYLPGVPATYTNTGFGTQLGSTASAAITLVNHGLTTGMSVYIRVKSGTLQSGFVSSVNRTGDNTFNVVLPSTSANSAQSCEVCYVDELTRFTPSNGSRYFVKSILVTDDGSNYVIPEKLEVVESNVNDSNTGLVVKIRKQRGAFFEGSPEIINTEVFTYTVKNSNEEGFFLYDEERREYLFLDKNTPETGLTSAQGIRLERFDGIDVNNILQFKFAQSSIHLRGYIEDVFSIGSSISGAINNISNTALDLKARSRLSIQNTKRPTPATSEENILGYTYNSFAGRDVVIWQRVALRDQDYVLNPNDTALGANSITGDRLRNSVSEFVMGPVVSWTSTASGVVTIALNNHSVQTGDTVRVSSITATSGNAFNEGPYTATYINASSFSINVSSTTASSGTLNLVIPDPNFQIRVPGLFIKVGTSYRRAFSTTDKPFYQSIIDATGANAFANPTISGSGQSFTGQSYGALSAEGTLTSTNPLITNWYSYSTTISELAQRIHTNGIDGAFYYHRPTAPAVTNVNVTRNGAAATIYAVPLFTLAS
jgi:hypothetical protein